MKETIDVATLDTLDVSLCKKYNNHQISLRDMAVRLHECGWTNFIDESRAQKIIDEYNNNI